MLTLFRHRAVAAGARPRRNDASSSDNTETTAIPARGLEQRALSTPGGAARLREMLAVGPSRKRNRRYRSRNCRNFKRYGDFFQFVDPSGYAAEGSRNGRTFSGRRSARGHDRLLMEEVQDMQQRVLELEQKRSLLESAMLNAHANAITHAMGMVKQFYVLFANGYDPVKAPVHAQSAAAFLRAIMEKDVVCTEFKGVDLFLHQYQVSSQGHASIKLSLQGVTAINDASDASDGVIQIYANATCTLRINRETLVRFFPRIISDEELTQQLIGREYVLQYDKVFHFQSGQVFQHESRVDFCNGLLDMVKDPFVVMKLLEASLMTKHGHLKVDHRIEEDQHTLENSVL